MSLHPRAGAPAQPQDLINVPALMAAYYVNEPNPRRPQEKVRFGTSGHRGSALNKSFNEAHVLAICQAICGYRAEQNITGPLLLGKDTHALSEAAFVTALEVFIGNGIEVHVQQDFGYTPTPVISHEIIKWNRTHPKALADGVVITPSHNPPQDGGIKYNPPHGGPADTNVTKVIEKYSNAIMSSGLVGVNAADYDEVLGSPHLIRRDWQQSYVEDLAQVIQFDKIRAADLKLGVNAMGGAGAAYWQAISERYQLNLEIINAHADPTFGFMTLDKDGAIRMDCSSEHAMAGLVAMREQFDLSFGNDPDYDRHGIVTPAGLMNPNHFLAVCIDYLLQTRNWQCKRVGKTVVSSAMIDRVVAGNQAELYEVPVGFKWFAEQLAAGDLLFAGEESAGASFLDFSGHAFSTDKDGMILALLAAEIQAVTGKSPSEYYQELEEKYGNSYYRRVDVQATHEMMSAFYHLMKTPPTLDSFVGESPVTVMNRTPGNSEEFGGIKVVTKNAWFAVRPSGTEPIYKIYAESFIDDTHLASVLKEAQQLVQSWLG